jgi:alkylation response protein AidB-like acyl-CoA dehydrogenase
MSQVYGVAANDPFVQAAAAIAKEVAGPNAADVDQKARFPKESLVAIQAKGLAGLTVPADLGGKGQGPRVFSAVVEELAKACPSTAMVYVMHVSAVAPIIASKTLASRAAVLRDIAAGKHLTTLALSEKGSRSVFWIPMSKLEGNGSDFKTSAQKSWVTSAGNADSYVSSAGLPGAKSPLESIIYLMDRKAAGVKVVSPFEGMGLRGNDSSPVSLENVKISKDALLCAPGEGIKVMLEMVLPWFAIGSAAMAHGLCLAAIGATAGHLSGAGFEFNGSKLRDLPNLRARLADMSVRTEQSRALLGYTLGLMEKPSEITPLYVLQSRLAAVRAAVDVTDLAMKTCGGAAFSKHLPLERLFRDARAGWVMAPTADHLEDLIGKALTGLPLL